MRPWLWVVIVGLISTAGTIGWVWRSQWMERRSSSNVEDRPRTATPTPAPTSIALSDQTVKTLGLISKPVRVTDEWRKLTVPGVVADRPGISDRGVTSPITGVLLKIHVAPGDVVRPGDGLFTLRIVGEALQAPQSELFKAIEELKIVAEQIERFRQLDQNGAIPGQKRIDAESQKRRLEASVRSLKHELTVRGLSSEQIRDVEEGRFISEFIVSVPKSPTPEDANDDRSPPTYEVHDLRVELGQQVQSGQALAELADHRLLGIEGRAFKHEASLIEAAAQNGWPVAVEFLATSDVEWSKAPTSLRIRSLGNNVDPISRTFPFTLALTNQSKTVKVDDRSILSWRYRPGQRVRLAVPVEKLDKVIVLPPDAVTKDGTERVVFRHNGNVFERRSVQVVLEERDRVILADDGSLSPGTYVVQNQATALLRAMKAQAPKPAVEGGHWHADGSFHPAPKEEGE